MTAALVNNPRCAPLPDAREMASWDAAAVTEGGVPAEKLMANAGLGALRCLEMAWSARLKTASDCEETTESTPVFMGVKVLLFMGKGNNGGDAAVLARLLLQEGAEVLLCRLHALPDNLASSTSAADIHLRQALDAGVTAYELSSPGAALPEGWEEPDIIVDGLLGTGFTPPLRSEFQQLIDAINLLSGKQGDAESSLAALRRCVGWFAGGAGRKAPDCLVLALDIPSGLCAQQGTPSPVAVRADLTVTFEAPKMGLLLHPAREFTGRLLVQPVGIPAKVQVKYPPKFSVLLPGCAQAGRPLSALAHKGRAGRVLVIGGSPGLTGAPHLSALAALRAGAGLVRIACPAGLAAQVKYNNPDIMTLPLGDAFVPGGQEWDAAYVGQLIPALAACDAVVIGPGLGLSGNAHALVEDLLHAVSGLDAAPPLLLDADALTIIAACPGLSSILPRNAVLTPHPGEAARLLKCTAPDIEADRPAALSALLGALSSAVLLKGAGTLLGQGGSRFFLPFIEPNLAVGGSGDVLSGIIAAFLAQDASPLEAACAGAYVHGLCGHMLAEVAPERGNLASDIAGSIPRARAMVRRLPPKWLPSFAVSGEVL